MARSEEEVLRLAQQLFDQNDFQKLKSYVYANHTVCETDDVKIKLLRLWEESVYQEFIDNRRANEPEGKSPVLSSSMRYKLRKKHPCPIELEQELRVKNARLPKQVHDGLNNWLKKHRDNPYPNKVEKEGLSAKLGITPQQVNRWFIQRRKMLRIRGQMYLGRGITDTPSDEEEDDDHDSLRHSSPSSPHHESHYEPHQQILLLSEVPEAPMLQSLLNSARSSPAAPQMMLAAKQPHLTSGGTVEVLENQLKLRMIEEDAAMPLTPPPSVSGESNHAHHRATPPEGATSLGYDCLLTVAGEQREALNLSDQRGEAPLDLTKSSIPKTTPVTLERVSPSWRKDSADLFDYRQQEQKDLEMIAASALISLSRA